MRQVKSNEAAQESESSYERDSTGARSLRRAADIMDLLQSRGTPLSVAEIVKVLGLPRSSAYEIIRVLTETGLLSMDRQAGKVALGRRLFDLGMAYRSQNDLLREGSRLIGRVRDDSEETVQLSVLEGDRVRILLKEEGTRAVRIISNVGSLVPVNWAAAGRLLVSDLDDDALTRLLERTVSPSPTGRAATDVSTLISQIRSFRAQGYATEFGETNEHAGCVAAPVLDAEGRCIAALSIAAPEYRLRSSDFQLLKGAVVSGAVALSQALQSPPER